MKKATAIAFLATAAEGLKLASEVEIQKPELGAHGIKTLAQLKTKSKATIKANTMIKAKADEKAKSQARTLAQKKHP